jgi:hypothetical protein
MWLLVVYGVLGAIAVVAMLAFIDSWMRHRRSVKREQIRQDHRYRMAKLEQEERWLEVAEKEYDNDN